MSSVSEPLNALVRDALGASLVSEPRSDCTACVMCAPTDWSAHVPSVRFDDSVRCCTYLPLLWNFQVGGILAEGHKVHQRGVMSVLERVDGDAALPIGLVRTSEQEALHATGAREDRYGRDPDLRCPHYIVDGGQCGIHAFRNARCSTWHCRHDRGQMGQGYWGAVGQAMARMEILLASQVLRELGAQPQTWTDGVDREAFYVACWEASRRWTWAELEPEASPELLQALGIARRATKGIRRSLPLPEVLRVHGGRVLREEEGHVLVDSYSPYDPVRVPTRLWRLLDQVDGRSVGEARNALKPLGVAFGDELVHRLLEWGVLRG